MIVSLPETPPANISALIWEDLRHRLASLYGEVHEASSEQRGSFECITGGPTKANWSDPANTLKWFVLQLDLEDEYAREFQDKIHGYSRFLRYAQYKKGEYNRKTQGVGGLYFGRAWPGCLL